MMQTAIISPPIGTTTLAGLKEKLKEMSWSSPRNSAIFNSGPYTVMLRPPIERPGGLRKEDVEINKKYAGETFSNPRYAGFNKPLAQTEGGKVLQKIYQSIPDEWRGEIDGYCSKLFAQCASGHVVAFIEDAESRSLLRWENQETLQEESNRLKQAISPSLNPANLDSINFSDYQEKRLLSIWLKDELPALLANPNIESINGVPITDLKKFYQDSNYEEVALVQITRALAKAFHENQPFDQLKVPPFGSSTLPGEIPPFESTDVPIAALPFPHSSANGLLKLARSIVNRMPSLKHQPTATGSDPRALFTTYGQIPGGILISIKNIEIPFEVESLRIDPKDQRSLIINDTYRFETNLLPDELVLLMAEPARFAKRYDEISKHLDPTHRKLTLRLIHETDTLFPAVGAISAQHTTGTSKLGIVGGVLRDADHHLGANIFTDRSIASRILLEGVENFEKLKAHIEPVLSTILDSSNSSIIHEITGARFVVRGKALVPAQLDHALTLVSYKGNARQPEFTAAQQPSFELNKQEIEKTGLKPLQSSPAYQRVFRYAQVLALVKKCVLDNPAGLQMPEFTQQCLTDPLIIKDTFEQRSVNHEQRYRITNARAFDANIEWMGRVATWKEFIHGVGICFVQAVGSKSIQNLSMLERVCKQKLCEITPPAKWESPFEARLALLACRLAEGHYSSEVTIDSKRSGAFHLKLSSLQAVTTAIKDCIEKGAFQEAAAKFVEIPSAADAINLEKPLENNQLSTSFKLARFTRILIRAGYGSASAKAVLHGMADLIRSKGLEADVISWQSLTALAEIQRSRISPHLNLSLLFREHFGFAALDDSLSSIALIWGNLLQAQLPNTPAFSKLRESTQQFIDYHQTFLGFFTNQGLAPSAFSKRTVERALATQALIQHPAPRELAFPKVKNFPQSTRAGIYRIEQEQVIRSETSKGSTVASRYNALVDDGIKAVKSELQRINDIPLALSRMLRVIYHEQKYSIGNVNLLTDAINLKKLDCDTSAYICFDILEGAGLAPELVLVPGHAFIKVDRYYLETVQGQLIGQKVFEDKYGGIGVFCSSHKQFLAGLSHSQLAGELYGLIKGAGNLAALNLTIPGALALAKKIHQRGFELSPEDPSILQLGYLLARQEGNAADKRKFEKEIRSTIGRYPAALCSFYSQVLLFENSDDPLVAQARLIRDAMQPLAAATGGELIMTTQSAVDMQSQIAANTLEIKRRLDIDLASNDELPLSMRPVEAVKIKTNIGAFGQGLLDEMQFTSLYEARSTCNSLIEMRRMNFSKIGKPDDLYHYSLELWLQPVRLDIRCMRARAAFDQQMLHTVIADLYDIYVKGDVGVVMPNFLPSALSLTGRGQKVKPLLDVNRRSLDPRWVAEAERLAAQLSTDRGTAASIITLANEASQQGQANQAQRYVQLLTPRMRKMKDVAIASLNFEPLTRVHTHADVRNRWITRVGSGLDRQTAAMLEVTDLLAIGDVSGARKVIDSGPLRRLSTQDRLGLISFCLNHEPNPEVHIQHFERCREELGNDNEFTRGALLKVIRMLIDTDRRSEAWKYIDLFKGNYRLLEKNNPLSADEQAEARQLVECYTALLTKEERFHDAQQFLNSMQTRNLTSNLAWGTLKKSLLVSMLPWLGTIEFQGARSVAPHDRRLPFN